MAEEFAFSFTNNQIEAILMALERCGINGGDTKTLVGNFRDPENIRAAQASHALLRRKGQKQARGKDGAEPIRELFKETDATPLAERQAAYRRLRSDYMDLLTEAGEILKAVRTARDMLNSKLDVQKQKEDRAAIELLSGVLGRFRFKESDLGAKLTALEGERDT